MTRIVSCTPTPLSWAHIATSVPLFPWSHIAAQVALEDTLLLLLSSSFNQILL